MSIPVIATSGCWLAFAIVVMLRFSHVLQVERYHTDSYIKWMMGGGSLRIFSPKPYYAVIHMVSAVCFLLVLFSVGPLNVELSLLAVAALLWVAAGYRAGAGFKKPLVVTARVKRLFATIILIDALFLSQLLGHGERAMVGGFVLIGYFQFLLVAVGNILVSPLEDFLQRGFKKDASKKLAGKKVIAITGSYGKTGVKEALGHMLETSFPLLKSPGSYNTPMGLSRAINEGMEPHHEIFIAEMGATRRGDIKELCQFVRPDIGIITATGEAHLETFITSENVALTKFELADALAKDGVLVINNDYRASRRLSAGRQQRIITYGAEAESDFMPLNLRCGRQGSTFDLKTPEGVVADVNIKLLGKLNVINVTAAFAVGSLLGMNINKMKAAAASLKQMEARLQLIENPGSYLIINDGFNSNPIGAVAAVEVLGYFKGYKKILVTPGIVDLGDSHEEANNRFGKAAAHNCDRVILINERRTKPIRDGLIGERFPEDNIKTFPSLAKAREHLKSIADEKSVVLFENDLPDHMEDF